MNPYMCIDTKCTHIQKTFSESDRDFKGFFRRRETQEEQCALPFCEPEVTMLRSGAGARGSGCCWRVNYLASVVFICEHSK